MTKIRTQTDEQVATYLSRCRSISDISNEFDLTPKDARAALRKLSDVGYDVVSGPKNIHGDATFVAVPNHVEDGEVTTDQRIWRWQAEASGQPYGAVIFPATFKPSKIKIIPIDGIHFGSSSHDATKFDTLIDRIAKDDQTFCFLNGDILSEISGGPRDQREHLLLERIAVFTKKMQHISHKILWAQQGCLEARSAAQQGFDPLEYFCTKLGVPYFKEPCYVDIHWAGQLFTVWAMHGQSTAQMKGAKLNALRRPAVVQEWTHFVVAGHVGDAMWNRAIKIVRDPVAGRLTPKEEFHVILGNFKRFLGTQSARKGHQPPSNEILVLSIYADGQHHCRTASLGGGQ